ncbi:hypothetical protein RN001_010366 [Aquatica leii]|uniref:Cytochrome P450 n=1 Tax=Aquatica leii TaxID=1421715 RepID=A0AAN7SQA4_9COLE|nr:hypothetical protein RN001_010366 [Aquatica leii]
MLVNWLLVLVALWCVRYYWSRRRLYQCARQRPSPFALPFVGNAFYLFGHSRDIFDKVFKFHSIFASPTPLWLGSHLFFIIWDPQNLKIVLNNQNCLRKSFFYKYIEDAIGRGLISHDVPKWKRHRKMIGLIFNKKVLNSFVEIFYNKSLILSQRFEKLAGENTDVFDVFSCFAVDVLMQTGVGVDANAQTSDCHQAQWFNTAKDVTFIRMNNIFYHFDFIFRLSSYSKQFYQAINNIETMIGSVVKEQIALNLKQNTFLQQLIEASNGDDDFTETDLIEEVITFLIGGNDTVSTTLSYTLMVLGMYPDIQEKIYVEVKNTVGLDQPITHTDLFDPDRFGSEVIRDPYSWIPFSSGPRNCVAFKYAFMVMKVAIATLIRNYQFSSTYKNVADIKFQANLLLKPIDGFKVSVQLRK